MANFEKESKKIENIAWGKQIDSQIRKGVENIDKTKCSLCGLCKNSCPIYSVLFNEADSPRGKAVLLKENFLSKHFYLCTFCKACENACILKDIDLVESFRKAREELAKKGIQTEANRRMIANIRAFGNALGKVEKGKKVELFCC